MHPQLVNVREAGAETWMTTLEHGQGPAHRLGAGGTEDKAVEIALVTIIISIRCRLQGCQGRYMVYLVVEGKP